MARTKGVTISVKIPIDWDALTDRSKQRLRQTVGRDTRIIRSYLRIIEQYEEVLLTGKNKDRIDDTKLDQLTITALKVKSGYKPRPSVPHDFKSKFPRISTNELQECRQTAVALYESYLRLRNKPGSHASRPIGDNSSRRIPRWVFSQRFVLFEKKTSVARWWLSIRDAFDSSSTGKRIHDRVLVPLKVSPYHLSQLGKGDVKALQLFSDNSHKWWVTNAVRVDLREQVDCSLPVAILGIDLGIEKSACSTLLTPEKTRETRYFYQTEKATSIKKYDGLVASLQHELHTRQNQGQVSDEVANRLRLIRSKRANIAREYDRILVRQLLDYISELSKNYTLYVAIGRLTNIRVRAKRGGYQGSKFRGLIHSWAFARITHGLQHGLAQLGWVVDGKDARFRAIPESWTSIICWKCGSKGVRPKQNYFYCPSCGQKTNADRNGSTNIAARMLTLTKSLHSVRGLGLWTRAIARRATAQRARPKAQAKEPSRGKSLLSRRGLSSSPGESAAVHHAQLSLTSFSDGAGVGDNDPAVEKTVEKLSVTEDDGSVPRQEKEVRSVGGIPSR